jgi:hypothetical protein
MIGKRSAMPITVVCSITQNEVMITRHGRPVAQLTGLQAPTLSRRLGVAHGRFTLPGSIDVTNPLIAELFEPGSGACCWMRGTERCRSGSSQI